MDKVDWDPNGRVTGPGRLVHGRFSYDSISIDANAEINAELTALAERLGLPFDVTGDMALADYLRALGRFIIELGREKANG